MLFNSIEFLFFFVCVFGLYLVLSHRWQNLMLLVASYIFYAAWDWRFLSLLILSTVVDYFCGLKMDASPSKYASRKFLVISVVLNLSVLCVFKYFNFFTENFYALMTSFGLSVHPRTFNIILPMGISFYTFQTMSYTIDIYNGKMKPTNKFLDFALFVSFFPQLVAGPIERARCLLPQIQKPRTVTWAKFNEGSFLIFWGLYLKIFVADNLAHIVDPIFSQTVLYSADQALLGGYAFAFQIFCDFAGYSSIARGLSRCMGFELMVNFNLPYFATNPQEFWRRWHISLSTWLRDYLYIPLGGARGSVVQTYRNLMIVMVLGGLWHGAAWNFLIWGLFHGALLALHRIFRVCFPRNQTDEIFVLGKMIWVLKVVVFFHITCIGWLIFRAQSLDQVHRFLLSSWHDMSLLKYYEIVVTLFPYVGLLVLVQCIQYIKDDLMAMYKLKTLSKAVFYFVCLIMMIIWGVTGGQDFIYFQF